jgi:hypothetical protein
MIAITAAGFLGADTAAHRFSEAATLCAVAAGAMPAFPHHLFAKNIQIPIQTFQGGHHAS